MPRKGERRGENREISPKTGKKRKRKRKSRSPMRLADLRTAKETAARIPFPTLEGPGWLERG